MVFRIGWFSTGRDEAARELLQTVVDRISEGTIRAELSYTFCNRAKGESVESDRFIDLVESLRIPLILFSSRDFLPSLRKRDLEEWRRVYHQEVGKRIRKFGVDTIVLAGYMLIVSPSFCETYPIINLHPAAPGGPKGTWEEVIFHLMRLQAKETGVMMHRVTKDLDAGPVLTYVTFPIRGPNFDPLWEDMEKRLEGQPFELWARREGRDHPLFKEIRREGVRRELPLIVMTLKALADGKVKMEGGRVLDENGKEIHGSCLNKEVEEYLLGIPSIDR